MTAHNYIHHTKSVQQILGLHMRMPKPRAVTCEWAQEGLQLNRTWKCISGLWRLSTACTWLVKTPQRDFFFCTLSGFLLAFLASFVHQLSQCRQPLAVFSTRSTLQNTHVAEAQLCCSPCPPLSRTVLLPCPQPSSSVHVTHEFLSEHARECKQWVQIDVPERDTYVCTHVHCENRSLIRSLALMRSAINATT